MQQRFDSLVRFDFFGVANKCTFCIERIDGAAASQTIPGIDPEATPACATSCISKAIRFGDFADPASEVSQLLRGNQSFQMHGELGTEPQIHYLYEVPATMPGRAPDPADYADDALSDRANPLVGQRQTFWDYRAAMNFAVGGMGAGLAASAAIARTAGVLDSAALRAVYVVAAAFMLVGLFFVFLKIGRKTRFLRVLLRPQSSWMTRETYCVAAFYPAVVAGLMWPHSALDTIAAATAVGFLVCQANAAKGIPTWRTPDMPWMLIFTGLFEGTGLLALIAMASDGRLPYAPSLAVAAIVLALINAALWARYRAMAKARGIGPLSRRVLASMSPVLHVIGHAAPVVLFTMSLLAPSPLATVLAGAGGAAVIAGGLFWKFYMVTRACHQQGFALPVLPRRGSGKRAAPERLGAAHEMVLAPK